VRRIAILIICACALPVSAARAWTWPVDGPVLRPFSFDHSHPYAAGQHRGVDVGAPSGSPVLAPSEGVVSFAGTVPTGGKTVSIQTPSGYTATLVHLGSIGVTRGALVREASVVGTVGPSGVVELTEPYVYFGMRLTSDPQGYVDPLTFLPPRVGSGARPAAEAAAEPAAAPPVLDAAPAVDAVASSAPETGHAAPEATAAVVVPAAESATSSDAMGDSAESTVPIEPVGAATPVARKIARDEAPTIRPEASAVTSKLATTGKAVQEVQAHRLRVAVHEKQDQPAAGRQAQIVWRAFEAPKAGISQTEARASGRGSRLPAALGVAAIAVLVALRRLLRRKPLDTLPIMDSGDQLLHHDTDLLRQLDAPHRPRVHDDRGRRPHAPSQAAGRRDLLSDGNGRARLQGLTGGRGAGARPEDVCRPDRRSLERAA
jgi:hypothetical protein